MAEQRVAHPHVGQHGTAQKAGQQYRAGKRGSGHQGDEETRELQRADAAGEVHRQAQPGERLHDRWNNQQLDHAVEQ